MKCLHILSHYEYYKNGRALTCSKCEQVLRFDKGKCKVNKKNKEVEFISKD